MVNRIRAEGVLVTERLASRPCRAADPASENAALHAIARQFASEPDAVLNALAEWAVKLCAPDGSAGVSVLDEGADVFRWVAMAGAYASYAGGTTPGGFSPCGTTLHLGCPQLFDLPARVFTYFREASPELVEGPVIPFEAGAARGTIWVAHHAEACRFTAEDVRLMTSLASFTAASLAARQGHTLLRQREERLRRMVNIEGVGVLTFDAATGTLVDANDWFLAMSGYSREEVAARGLTWRTMTPPEHVEESLRQMDQLARTGRIGPYEKDYYRKDGSRSWMLFAGASVGDGAVVEYCIDIGDRKRAEAALRESEERYRRLVETAHEGVWTIDADGSTTYVNRRMAELLGHTPEQMIGRPHTDFMWEQDRPKGDADMELRRQGTAQVWDQRYRRQDGSELWMVASCTSLYDSDGKVVGALGMFTDITDRKRAEAERQSLLDSERAARSEAEAANRAKDRFLAVLSHELRTPLSPVVMTVPAIESDPEMPPKFCDDLAMVRRNIDLEVKLIDDLLDLSRVSSGKLRLQMQPVGVHELLVHVLRNSLSEAAGKCLHVRQELDAADDRTTADPTRLQQVSDTVAGHHLRLVQSDDLLYRILGDGKPVGTESWAAGQVRFAIVEWSRIRRDPAEACA